MAADALSVEAVASVVQRLAVMLGAGVAPRNAWRYLSDAGEPRDHAVDTVARSVIAGGPIPAAIMSAASSAEAAQAGSAWRAVAASWFVANESGAPLASSLRETADSLRQIGQLHRDVDAALAGPRSTARFVGVMPVLGLLFGTLLGFDTIGVLFGTPLGISCLVAGALLTAAAARWTSRLVAKARPSESSPGLTAQLVAIGLSGGGSLARARGLATEALRLHDLGESDDPQRIDRVLELSRAAGVPAAELLQSEARQLGREATSRAQSRAAALGTTLMIPLGVCVLPAFMLLGVAPMMISIFSSTVVGLS
ncbi:type II secretion system F family protein [Agreia pratensis]|uniref:type II secretion system F family protein n=1 Tax=Agreia pratensis TaxID=150121 RepID=UPI00188AE3B7|nr:type II secretion system F family protein [Agreia pratensis]MBF4633225.1 type II secretion system F family protein [Agreia pratensis]